MKTRLIAAVAGLAVFFGGASLVQLKDDEQQTTTGTYLGFMDDEYYSFETSDDFLDFYSVAPDVLKAYNLKGTEYEGSEFSISYSVKESEENHSLHLEKLQLIKKYSEEESEED